MRVASMLYYREAGTVEPGRPALVLIHGDFSDGEGTWQHQLTSEALARACRMIAVDRRGAGKSPKEPRPYSIHGEALDVLAVLDHAGISRFHLAGHSYGGLIAWEVARLAPGRIKSLHLIEPPYLSLLPGDPDVQALQEATEAVAAGARTQPLEATAESFFRALMGDEAVQRIKQKPAWEGLVREAERYGWQELPASYPPERLEELAAAREKPPVVVYTGGRSHAALQKVARRLAEAASARLVIVPEAGHAVQHAGDALQQSLLLYLSAAG
ncbi:MAG: hypothetical protein CW345_09335 [Firmicutes bacterium]|nr:hypothetical protein [Bacillota bacterium]MBO2521984.1 hypothetical protein [Bacillota bacterium]